MAKHDKLILPIEKSVKTTDFFVLKYGSTERGKVLDVEVKDIDGTPYDLTDLDLVFIEEMYNGNVIVDDGSEDKSGKFSNTDLKNGKFSYQFQEDIYQYDGWAHFKFTRNGNLIDTTAGFSIKIIDDIDSDLDSKSYIAYFEKIKKEHQTWLDRAKELLTSAEDLNTDNHNVISTLRKSLEDLTGKHNQLSKTVSDNFNSLTDRIDTLNQEKDSLKNQIEQLIKDKNQLRTEVNQLTQDKNNLSSQINTLKNINEEQNQQLTKLTPVHVKSVDDVAKQNAYFVIVDD